MDPLCPLSCNPGTQVHEDYDCTLNQTNIGSNNNKFYIIQLLEEGDCFICWNRWGHVDAQKDFEKKFRDKTKNSWAERDHFVAHPSKYTLIEVQREDEAQEAMVKVDRGPVRTVVQQVQPCSLDAATQKLITNIFSKDTFKNAMAIMNLVEAALKAPADRGRSLEELSSHFYTIIPHNFGHSQPPPINSPELLQAKKDMLLVLADIELAQTLQAAPEETKWRRCHTHWTEITSSSSASSSCWTQRRLRTRWAGPHRGAELAVPRRIPLLGPSLAVSPGPEESSGTAGDKWRLVHTLLALGTQLLVSPQVIHTYLEKTGSKYSCPALQHSWTVNREGEGDQFQAHDKLGNRKLLWHGTNMAVVAAILTSGLRIMPHSGGRVGKGIYFASENSKEYHITVYEPSLKQPPPGFDSVIARGHTEPVPTQDTKLELDGQRVVVP
eukprot:bmy_11542T0